MEVVTQMEQAARARARIAVIGSYAIALVMDVDRLPHEGETLLARNFRHTYGGKGSDMAVQAARLGTEVHFVGCVGDDDYGRDFASLLSREGIHAEHLQRRGERATGAGFIIKTPAGANIITVDMGANELLSGDDLALAEQTITRCGVMLIQLEIPLAAALDAARLGRRHGLQVILNPAPAQDLRAVDLSSIDVLTPNETEARVCLGLSPADQTADDAIGQRLLQQGCRNVAITLGERGALIVGPEGATRVPAPSVDAIDTNGAGDAFNAGLATALGEGVSLASAVAFANAVAALSCTRRETVPSYHTRAEVDRFVERSHGAAAVLT
jgi:ribokinase